MYFRLTAAIFDLQVTPTSESSNMCHRVSGPQQLRAVVGNLVISRSNHVIIITSGLMAAILILVGVA